MTFIADFHLHTSYSRATSKFAEPYSYASMAKAKGIDLLGTGDITHPEYFEFLKENLVEFSPGIYRLKERKIIAVYNSFLPDSISDINFILTGEISTIYKDGDKTRKIHHVVVLSCLDAAERFIKKLDTIGNIRSDGRPILGLHSRDLYAILLESDPDGYIIPAHIWTPWFSLFGNKSGYDTIKECYKDFADNIFACETGLSSDPLMNYYVPELDNITLVSNSDAHSPNKLGREANLFSCKMDFYSIKEALKIGEGFEGTIEFFPEEGKYHYDGHRKCNVSLTPQQALELDNKCPVCGKQLTFGVYHRIIEMGELSRNVEEISKNRHPFKYIIPLPEIISEIVGFGVTSKRVVNTVVKIHSEGFNEFDLLTKAEYSDIDLLKIPLLSEAIRRLRSGDVIRESGYDGEFGRINLFKKAEKDELLGQSTLFSIPKIKKQKKN